ncbi:MAG: hypothetical protein WA110_06145 [Anaerolineaceae bacterium]
MEEDKKERERFVETGEHSFYGEYLYDQIVPQEHYLRKLQQIIEWKRFTQPSLARRFVVVWETKHVRHTNREGGCTQLPHRLHTPETGANCDEKQYMTSGTSSLLG